jgi:SAM-dependent methyltransferase
VDDFDVSGVERKMENLSKLEAFKALFPWWFKIATKVILARLPLGGRIWQMIGLFRPGGMLDSDYAIGVFDRCYEAAGNPPPGFTFLELGPGDTLSSAVIGRARGAKFGWLVDAGSYASQNLSIYSELLVRLSKETPDVGLGQLRNAPNVQTLINLCDTAYLEDGLESLKKIPDDACDFIFSNAVLEHVPKDQFSPIMVEFFRILKPGGISPHMIDFRDHLGGDYNNLRFSEKLWEAPWFSQRSGFYTNRLQCSEVEAIMKDAGFNVTLSSVLPRDCTPSDRGTFNADFSNLDDAAFTVKEALVTLKKPLKTRN